MADDRCRAVGKGHVAQLGHDLAAGHAGVDLQPHLTERVAPLRALRAQALQPLDARHAARAPRFDTLADPLLLLRQQLVGARVGQRVGSELIFLEPFVGAEVAGVAAQHATIELDDARGHRIEEGAVMGDQHHAALESDQQLLEPGDRVQVQVVGGFVEQQHLGHGHQRLRQGDTLLHAAGQAADVARAVQMQLRQRGVHTLLPVPGIEGLDARLQRIQIVVRRMQLVARAQRTSFSHAFADDVEDAVRRLEQRFLRHVADAQALRHLQQPVVELLLPGQHLQQRGLARAIAADQAQALAGLERKRRAVEQRDMSVGQVGIRQGQDGHGCVRRALERQEPDSREPRLWAGEPIHSGNPPFIVCPTPARAGADASRRHNLSHPGGGLEPTRDRIPWLRHSGRQSPWCRAESPR